MRDPKRIDGLLDAIREIWTRFPDVRLGQIIVNATQPKNPCPEVFNIEDSKLLKRPKRMSDSSGDNANTNTSA